MRWVKRAVLLVSVIARASEDASEDVEVFATRILQQFDADESGDWDTAEHTTFMASLKNDEEVLSKADAFKLADSDANGRISLAEWTVIMQASADAEKLGSVQDPAVRRKILETMFPESQPEVEYKDADGETRTMSRQEMIEKLMAQDQGQFDDGGINLPPGMIHPKGYAYEQGFERDADGNLVRKREETMKLNEIKEKNPELNKFMQIGRFAHEQLQASGYAMGNMSELTTSPREPTTVEESTESTTKGKTWRKGMFLTVTQKKENAEGKKTKKNRTFTAKYEVEVEFNRDKHPAPGLRVVNAWRVDKKTDERIEDLPLLDPVEEEPSSEGFDKLTKAIINIAGVAICVAIVKIIRTGMLCTHMPFVCAALIAVCAHAPSRVTLFCTNTHSPRLAQC